MKDVKEFVANLVKIEYIEHSGCFGHYPFSMYVENKESKSILSALAFGGDVKSCYDTFRKHLYDGAKRIYMAVDFPKGGDMLYDFVCVFSCEGTDVVSLFAIPYTDTGEILTEVTESNVLSQIKEDFIKYATEFRL